jgi:hypothetical protein
MDDDLMSPGVVVVALVGAACILIVVLLALGSVVGLVWSVRREKAVQAQLRDLPNPPDQPAPSL